MSTWPVEYLADTAFGEQDNSADLGAVAFGAPTRSNAGWAVEWSQSDVATITQETPVKNTSAEFRPALEGLASRLNIKPEWLISAINFETGGSFSPSVRNKASGATGLIQFMPTTAKALGTSTDELAKMTDVQQLEYVEKYFRQFNKPLLNLGDVYSTILWPKAVGKPDDFVLFKQGTMAYRQNSGLDVGKKGYVTRGDAVSYVEKRAKAMEARNGQ